MIDNNITNLTNVVNTKQPNIDSSSRLNANMIATGEVSNTKLNFLKNVTSDIQAQINAVGGGGGSSVPSINYDSNTSTTTIANSDQSESMDQWFICGVELYCGYCIRRTLGRTFYSSKTKLWFAPSKLHQCRFFSRHRAELSTIWMAFCKIYKT